MNNIIQHTLVFLLGIAFLLFVIGRPTMREVNGHVYIRDGSPTQWKHEPDCAECRKENREKI